jgi:hypothetical protein
MAEADPGKARKARRVSVSIASRLRYGGDKLAEIEIKDLSFYGFSASGTFPWTPEAMFRSIFPRSDWSAHASPGSGAQPSARSFPLRWMYANAFCLPGSADRLTLLALRIQLR